MSDDCNIVVHVGAPKCGSSALQLALCRAPAFADAHGRRHGYCFIDAAGRLVAGRAVRPQAALSSLGGRASRNVTSAEEAARLLGRAEPGLRRLVAAGEVPILSCEGWCRAAPHFEATGLLARLGGAHVILYIRPPCEWMNSAWWQWGVWGGADLDSFVQRNIANVRWAAMARAWAAVPGVEKVTVALASDVTTRFYTTLEAVPPPPLRANTGLPPAFLHFLLRHRRYRRHAHSVRTEFVVSQALAPRSWPAPWVLTPAQVALVMARTGGPQKALGRWLSAPDCAAMAADARWRDPAAYADRAPADPAAAAAPPALAELAGLLAAARGQEAAAAAAAARRAMAGAADPRAAADRLIAGHVDALLRRHALAAARTAVVEAARGTFAPPRPRHDARARQ